MGPKKIPKKVSKSDISQDELNMDAEDDTYFLDEDQLEKLMGRLEKFTTCIGQKMQGDKSLKKKIAHDPVTVIFQLLLGIQDSVESINNKFDNLYKKIFLD
jgi:hypothetical protein